MIHEIKNEWEKRAIKLMETQCKLSPLIGVIQMQIASGKVAISQLPGTSMTKVETLLQEMKSAIITITILM